MTVPVDYEAKYKELLKQKEDWVKKEAEYHAMRSFIESQRLQESFASFCVGNSTMMRSSVYSSKVLGLGGKQISEIEQNEPDVDSQIENVDFQYFLGQSIKDTPKKEAHHSIGLHQPLDRESLEFSEANEDYRAMDSRGPYTATEQLIDNKLKQYQEENKTNQNASIISLTDMIKQVSQKSGNKNPNREFEFRKPSVPRPGSRNNQASPLTGGKTQGEESKNAYMNFLKVSETANAKKNRIPSVFNRGKKPETQTARTPYESRASSNMSMISR